MPNLALVFPLVHVFPSVVYLHPIEHDPTLDQKITGRLEEVYKNELLKLIAPAPLREDRDRFLHLIQDVASRRDDYLNQLSALRLAGLHTHQEESITTIKGQVRSPKEEDKNREILWQARLLLKLGELFDQEQQEIAAQLSEIEAREDALFNELRKEADSSFSLTQDIFQSQGESDNLMPHRIKAWSQFYCLGDQHLTSELSVFITDQTETVTRIRDAQVEGLAFDPMKHVSLALPGLDRGSNEIDTTRLHDLTAEIDIERLCLTLLDPNSALQHCQEQTAASQALLDAHCSKSIHSMRLDLYPIEQKNGAQLFGCSSPGHQKTPAATSKTNQTILGVLTPLKNTAT